MRAEQHAHFFASHSLAERSASATHTIRACISKGGFEELRGACIRQGSPLTGEFLDLEREIDNFALPLWEQPPELGQLGSIEAQATKLREKAAGRI
jgi:hypothetical protein